MSVMYGETEHVVGIYEWEWTWRMQLRRDLGWKQRRDKIGRESGCGEEEKPPAQLAKYGSVGRGRVPGGNNSIEEGGGRNDSGGVEDDEDSSQSGRQAGRQVPSVVALVWPTMPTMAQEAR